jgi:hypothetical protein
MHRRFQILYSRHSRFFSPALECGIADTSAKTPAPRQKWESGDASPQSKVALSN